MNNVLGTESNGPDDRLFVARQPIFDLEQKLFAYELLYRSSFNNSFESSDGTAATLAVVREAYLVLGTQLTGKNRVFINFNLDLLKKKVPHTLRPETTIIEIQSKGTADGNTLELFRELKGAGFTIALDGFDPSDEEARALVDVADIVKVDFREASSMLRADIVRLDYKKKVTFLAEKVETLEEFFEAQKLGYVYFQGYFFGKPQIVSTKNILASKTNCLSMINEINRPDLDFISMEAVVRRDTFLTFTLLSYINSAYFGLRDRVSSIMQALSLLGEREVRRWACLVLMAFMGTDRPSEVTKMSLIRAKFCECLAMRTRFAQRAPEMFMTGMFSMLDVLVGRPLYELLDRINVSKDIRTALTTGDNLHGEFLHLVFAYERALWGEVESRADKLGIKKADILSDYEKSVQWAEQVFGLSTAHEEAPTPA
jgi:c-di-GMP-related signal transduction protein